MNRIVAALAFGLTATACMPNTAAPPPSAGIGRGQSQAPDPSDTCGAAQLRYLIGRPKTEIPVPVSPNMRRVTCTTCPVTMDFSPVRVNILFDQASGIVREIKCG